MRARRRRRKNSLPSFRSQPAQRRPRRDRPCRARRGARPLRGRRRRLPRQARRRPGDMDEKTALGEKRAGDEGKAIIPKGRRRSTPLDHEGNDADNDEERQHRHGAPSATRLGISASVQAAFEPGNQPAHPGDGMADRTREPLGVADRDFDQQCKERERREHGISPRSYAARPWRRPRPFLDLSTGINPHPEPVAQRSSEVFVRMPQPGRLRG